MFVRVFLFFNYLGLFGLFGQMLERFMVVCQGRTRCMGGFVELLKVNKVGGFVGGFGLAGFGIVEDLRGSEREGRGEGHCETNAV